MLSATPLPQSSRRLLRDDGDDGNADINSAVGVGRAVRRGGAEAAHLLPPPSLPTAGAKGTPGTPSSSASSSEFISKTPRVGLSTTPLPPLRLHRSVPAVTFPEARDPGDSLPTPFMGASITSPSPPLLPPPPSTEPAATIEGFRSFGGRVDSFGTAATGELCSPSVLGGGKEANASGRSILMLSWPWTLAPQERGRFRVLGPPLTAPFRGERPSSRSLSPGTPRPKSSAASLHSRLTTTSSRASTAPSTATLSSGCDEEPDATLARFDLFCCCCSGQGVEGVDSPSARSVTTSGSGANSGERRRLAGDAGQGQQGRLLPDASFGGGGGGVGGAGGGGELCTPLATAAFAAASKAAITLDLELRSRCSIAVRVVEEDEEDDGRSLGDAACGRGCSSFEADVGAGIGADAVDVVDVDGAMARVVFLETGEVGATLLLFVFVGVANSPDESRLRCRGVGRGSSTGVPVSVALSVAAAAEHGPGGDISRAWLPISSSSLFLFCPPLSRSDASKMLSGCCWDSSSRPSKGAAAVAGRTASTTATASASASASASAAATNTFASTGPSPALLVTRAKTKTSTTTTALQRERVVRMDIPEQNAVRRRV